MPAGEKGGDVVKLPQNSSSYSSGDAYRQFIDVKGSDQGKSASYRIYRKAKSSDRAGHVVAPGTRCVVATKIGRVRVLPSVLSRRRVLV